ncbi:MAG: radical SAM protein [Patescibacteria group bacterium]
MCPVQAKIYAAMVFDQADEYLSVDKRCKTDSSETSEISLVENKDDLKLLKIDPELFIIPAGNDNFILYPPSAHSCLLVNCAVIELLENLSAEKKFLLDKRLLAVINYLILHGVISFRGSANPESKDNADEKTDPDDEAAVYRPSNVVLCLTSDCNLRCTYCFASGGAHPRFMDESILRHAIDFILANAADKNKKYAGILFHGGGEPMSAFPLLKSAVEYARAEASKLKLECHFGIGTNLCYGVERLNYLIDNFQEATISMDGPKHIHDRQRPMANGAGSFDLIAKNLRELDKHGFHYTIRSTITRYGLDQMNEIVKFFLTNFSARSYQLEPLIVFDSKHDIKGREKDLTHGVGYDEFFDAFIKAREVALELGKDILTCSSNLFDFRKIFCGALHDNFYVTPEGNVSMCAEVLELDDPLADYFIVGKYDREKSIFSFNTEKIRLLQKRSIKNIERCKKCFAKYQCGGLCPLKQIRMGAGLMDTEDVSRKQCERIRGIIKMKLTELLSHPESQKNEEDYIKLGHPESLTTEDFDSMEFPLICP